MHTPLTIGIGSALVASAVPDTFMGYISKFLFAIFTASCASVISALIMNRLRKNK